ncbi:hypothetical protein HYS47_01710 [Candidatus Woesearchaeota archaeon]|nr:hypothetical protein [Candidatus Woesearchaeota archaeon]
MRKFLHYLHLVVDKLIFPSLLVILLLVVLELFFPAVAAPYRNLIDAIDLAIIILFVIDLSFKYARATSVRGFLRQYWIEIIAVIPFFLLFRMVEGITRVLGAAGETTKETQQLVHLGSGLSKQAEHELIGTRQAFRIGIRLEQEGRLIRLARFLRPLLRLPRFLKLNIREWEKRFAASITFFEEPFHSHWKRKK